ncbi:hypothetical protein [Pseudomonas sp. S2_H01]
MNVTTTSSAASSSVSTSNVKQKTVADTTQVPQDDDLATEHTRSADTVSLSKTSTDYSNSISNYAPYFPSRPGMSSDALALSVTKPGSVSSSKDRSFAEVADDARKRLDKKYALMDDSGKPYDGTDTDRNSVMGDLDRRSLNAIATNEGGQFSKEEQAAASALMRQQECLASGYYSGPADQQKNWKDPYANDPVGRAQAALAFLEGMSPEERSTTEWLVQHLTLEAALQQTGGVDVDPAKKKTGHFHNLSEILAGIVTDGSDKKEESKTNKSGGYVFENVQALLRSMMTSP